MAKEKVFIVATHKRSLKVNPKTGKAIAGEWETHEIIEFVDQLRKRHHSYSSAIGDYTNRKMISGTRYGLNDYDKFENYIRTKYKDQMAELDKAYRTPVSVADEPDNTTPVFVDQFGNVRAKTVFDL
jgi:hypothetical protein